MADITPKTAPATDNKAQGLVLTLGNAPHTYHQVSDPDTGSALPGLFHRDHPTPVGAPGELSVEAAQKLSDDPRIDLTIKEIAAKDVDALREKVLVALRELRNNAASLAREAKTGRDQDLLREQLDAAKGA